MCTYSLWQFLLERTLRAMHGKQTQGQHPDKPTRFAGADCECRNCKFAMEDGSEVHPVVAAAFVGEEVTSNARGQKTTCQHADKPDEFACAACPRRNGKFAMEVLKCTQLLWQLLLDRTLLAIHGKQTHGQHPDKPTMAQTAHAETASSPWRMALKRNQVLWQPLFWRNDGLRFCLLLQSNCRPTMRTLMRLH